MSEPLDDAASGPAMAMNPVAARWVGFGLAALGVLAVTIFSVLRTSQGLPPKEIAGDPLLVKGRAVYLDRCVSCHGASGRGDGPIAKGLAGPPVGDLGDATWKHGDSPEQVTAVIEQGVTNSAMPAWGRALSPDDLRAVTAFVYYLAGRKVPPSLRTP